MRQWRRATVATPGEWQCKTGGPPFRGAAIPGVRLGLGLGLGRPPGMADPNRVRRLAVANGPNIFQMLLVKTRY